MPAAPLAIARVASPFFSSKAVPSRLIVLLPLLMDLISFSSSFSSTLTLVPSWLTLMFLSPLKSTVSPGATLVEASSPFVERFQPLLAVSFTAFNWLTFTASVSASPAFTLVILPVWSKVTPPLITV